MCLVDKDKTSLSHNDLEVMRCPSYEVVPFGDKTQNRVIIYVISCDRPREVKMKALTGNS